MSDELVLDTAVVRSFVAGVHAAIGAAASPQAACDAIRPSFAQLLADPEWLPEEFRAAAPDSGMGGGIGHGCYLCLWRLRGDDEVRRRGWVAHVTRAVFRYAERGGAFPSAGPKPGD